MHHVGLVFHRAFGGRTFSGLGCVCASLSIGGLFLDVWCVFCRSFGGVHPVCTLGCGCGCVGQALVFVYGAHFIVHVMCMFSIWVCWGTFRLVCGVGACLFACILSST